MSSGADPRRPNHRKSFGEREVKVEDTLVVQSSGHSHAAVCVPSVLRVTSPCLQSGTEPVSPSVTAGPALGHTLSGSRWWTLPRSSKPGRQEALRLPLSCLEPFSAALATRQAACWRVTGHVEQRGAVPAEAAVGETADAPTQGSAAHTC